MFPTEAPGESLIERWPVLLRAHLPTSPLALPADLASWHGERGGHTTTLLQAPGVEQISLHRFLSHGRVRESNCIAIPADGYDLPGLHLVLYEFPDRLSLVADLVPMADVLFDTGYYERYLDGFGALVAGSWPRLVDIADIRSSPPRSRWFQQTGSCLNLALYLHTEGLGIARDFLAAAADCWGRAVAQATLLDGEAAADAARRKEQLFRGVWKTADLQSSAFPIMAEVLGDRLTRGLVDVIFGPRASWSGWS